MKKYINMFLVSSVVSMNMISCVAYSAPNYSYQENASNIESQQNYYPTPINAEGNTLKGHVIIVPANEEIPVFVSTPITSESAIVGQNVKVALGSDFTYGDKMIAPAGSTVIGTIIEASKAKRGSINGRICIRFTQINTPYGLQIPISAVVKTEDNSGVLSGGTKFDITKQYAKDIGIGAGAGALTGLVAGAIAGGAVGKATAIMTGIGAGAGVVKSAWDKGVDVEIPSGVTIDIVLTQPITVAPSKYDLTD